MEKEKENRSAFPITSPTATEIEKMLAESRALAKKVRKVRTLMNECGVLLEEINDLRFKLKKYK
ncbi:MAG TPA: hypothetical protein VFM82_02760 [Flavobacteriaceae bacterium]|nr:hypothetical protein [Flavobacteriaceae bacterium]